MNAQKNLLICGDNLNALDDLIKKGIQADLIYLDPPFFSNRHYEVIWGDEAEVRSFRDRWEGGMNVYIGWMKERIVKMYDVLKETGSFYLHCDWHASHYLKVMLDDVFGYKYFRDEIIWCYEDIGGKATAYFKRKHDVLFFYVKSDESTFNIQYKKLSESTIERYKKYFDASGKLTYRHLKETNPGVFKKLKGIPEDLDGVWLDIHKGQPLSDWWVDISAIRKGFNEFLGYPTQKPEALLERVIKSSSNKGDIVLDPFCGCGTALTVAQKLGRRWMGIDISPTAVNLITERLEKAGAARGINFEVVGMPTTLKELRKLEPFEFQNWVINEMKARQSKKLSSDFGLDGYYEKTIFTAHAGIQVKQSENVGRNVVDNFETALSRGKFEKGFIVAFSFTKGAHEEAARKKGEGLEIRLIEVEDLLLGKVKI